MNEAIRHLVCVDRAVQEPWQFLGSLPLNSVIVMLDTGSPGIEQVWIAAASLADLTSLQIVSHGAPGCLRLGGDVIDAEAVRRDPMAWTGIGQALAQDGQILLYGCEIGQGDSGDEFVRVLSEATGVAVAASRQVNGNFTPVRFDARHLPAASDASLPLPPTLDLRAYAHALVIQGDAQANLLQGTAGDDTIVGLAGNDTLIGLAGNDNVDTISDFSSGDRLVLDAAVFAGIGLHNVTLDATMLRQGAGVVTAGDANDHVIFNTSTGALYYDADGAGGAGAVRFATLTGVTSIAATSILVADQPFAV
ncbi:DUF4347 domain-containing protein [Leptothrix sp. BB-4]